MRIHFIAIGGAAMHNLAIALKINGFVVSGSDDLIAEPSKSRLLKHGLLPLQTGWDANLITTKLDAIILGMHARIDNPELVKAQELGLRIYSYPDYIYQQAINKTRIVVGGSHGKTTITSMILHVLNYYGKDFDYLVGAQIDGFDNMVKLSDAPIIIIEGDEYLASPIDKRPKFHIYKPHIAIISGIAWDHINVFPTFENYIAQFDTFIDTILPNGTLIYCAEDNVVNDLVNSKKNNLKLLPYKTPLFEIVDGKTFLINQQNKIELQIFGCHNLLNLNAAKLACNQIGINDNDFYKAIKTFAGAAKRLQVVRKNNHSIIFKDFAHSPSKLVATIAAVKNQFPNRKLIACLELHTFSSLNKQFLAQYKDTMNNADVAVILMDTKTFEFKGLTPFSVDDIKTAFNLNNVMLFNNHESFCNYMYTITLFNCNLLIMSSGNYGSLDFEKLTGILLDK